MSSSRNDKRWLKSVSDPDLVSFFEDSQFDAGEYAKGFFEQREASHAAKRVEKLEGLKRQTESALRAEVVNNYKAFMHATEEIRTMEAGLQTLKDLLGSTAQTLQTFRSVHLVDTVKPPEKPTTVRSNSRLTRGGGGGVEGDPEESGGEGDGPVASRGLKLPEWLDQAPIELEELLLERKHHEAVAVIRRVREFSENIQNATNLGRGVERIFQRVETMAQGMADRLMAEISAANTLTVWGFREHKSNFALLISLGHGEKAAIFFVGERSAMIRRSLRLVEVTADPLSYVSVLSETFFGQVVDAVSAFLKLFCRSARIHERRSIKTGKSTAYYQVYQGVKDCGTAPFCRLVVWVNQQIDQYAVLMGRQIRAVTMGPQRITREQSSKKGGGGQGGSAGGDAGFRLGPVASSLFSIVSLMLEEGFAAAAVLNTKGFPVGVQLASRLVPDVAHFLSSYVKSVKDNLVEAIRKDPFVSAGCRLVRPEALCVGTQEEEDQEAKETELSSSARILVLELRDILDYALVLLEPPPPEQPEPFNGQDTRRASLDIEDEEETQAASYYTRDEFLELEPVIVTSLDQLLRTYLKETIACMRARRDELSSNQSVAIVNNLAVIGDSYVPLLADWCAELLPEIADEEEVSNLRNLSSEFQRSAQNPLRTREPPGSSAGGGASSGRLPSSTSASDSKKSGRTSSSFGGGGRGGGGTPPVGTSSSSRHSVDSSSGAGRSSGSRRASGSSSSVKTSGIASGSGSGSGSGGGTSGGIGGSYDRSGGRSGSTAGVGASTASGDSTRDKIPSLKQSLNSRPSNPLKPSSSSSSSALKPSSSSSSSSITARGGAAAATAAAGAAAAAAAAAAGGVQATGRISVSSYAGASSSTAVASGPVSASAAADAAAARAKQAALAATAASSGNIRNMSVPGAGGSGAEAGPQRRPTLTLKAAREAAKAKAKAAAEAKAAREKR